MIEHVYSPDDLVEDLKRILRPDGLLLLSTPNLGYWLNRLLLLVGISPLFLENSSRTKLGRRTTHLGQNNSTEGHIRLFTYGAMRDFLEHAPAAAAANALDSRLELRTRSARVQALEEPGAQQHLRRPEG